MSSEARTYAFDSPSHRKFTARRTAARNAAFLLAHLKAGMKLLDAGCGGGSITVGLAEAVAPGEVIGLDIDAGQLKVAASLASERGLSNARFEAGSVYELPYPDGYFDAAYCHAVLMHLKDPLKALRELGRVLKPGGVIGVRESDERGNLLYPEHPDIDPHMPLAQKLIRHGGGDPLIGSRLKELLRSAGFARAEARAVYDTYSAPEAARDWAENIAASSRDNKERILRLGLATEEQMRKTAPAWREWAQSPDALYARSWVEALGWIE
jgi:ubiquinone/menaquinone biosynthesis C-methylase UbiE